MAGLSWIYTTIIIIVGGDMKKAKNKTAHAIKSIAERMANMACGSASAWGMYQPKEPKKLDKSKK